MSHGEPCERRPACLVGRLPALLQLELVRLDLTDQLVPLAAARASVGPDVSCQVSAWGQVSVVCQVSAWGQVSFVCQVSDVRPVSVLCQVSVV